MSKRRRLERQRRRERRERDAIMERGCNPEVFARAMGAAWALGAYQRERGAPSVLVMAPGVAERLADALAALRREVTP